MHVTADIMAAALDPSMTPDAVRLTIYYASLGEGGHPYDRDRLSELLEEAGEKRIRKALQRAERCGYLRRVKGGQATDRFAFSPAPKAGESRDLSPAQEGGEKLSPPHGAGQSTLSTPQAAGERPYVVVGGDGRSTPFNSPTGQNPLSVQAMQAISTAGEKLEGCRGALVDYLQARVKEGQQYGYVQSVVAWLDNPLQVFRDETGMAIPQSERVKLLAVALNEMAATDEGTYRAPVGDVRNVKNKVIALAKGYGKKATGTDGKRSTGRRGDPPDKQQYNPTPHWNGEFNG
jgi:hypothetical protein